MLVWTFCTGRKTRTDAWIWIPVQDLWLVSGQASRPPLLTVVCYCRFFSPGVGENLRSNQKAGNQANLGDLRFILGVY